MPNCPKAILSCWEDDSVSWCLSNQTKQKIHSAARHSEFELDIPSHSFRLSQFNPEAVHGKLNLYHILKAGHWNADSYVNNCQGKWKKSDPKGGPNEYRGIQGCRSTPHYAKKCPERSMSHADCFRVCWHANTSSTKIEKTSQSFLSSP